MTAGWLRRIRSLFAFATLLVFWNGVLQSSFARAQGSEPPAEPSRLVPAERPVPASPSSDAPGTASAVYDQATRDALGEHLQQGAAPAVAEDAPPPPELADVDRALAALPSGGGEISPQARALPSGAASQLGMGESFTMQLTTGTAGYSVPLKLPTARGGAQPSLQLSYSASGGFGIAGVGWSIGASAISRQTDRGLPRYDDRGSYHAEQDRFVFGGMELVPICTVTSGGTCARKLSGEVMPAWSTGWQYFRPRVESAFLRFFWSPDHRTWRVQAKDGSNMELGVPRDGSQYEGGLERNPDAPSEVYRWHLTRQYDSQGTPNAAGDAYPFNVIVYRYLRDGAAVYLSDIFDTSPADTPTGTDVRFYAHHTSLHYEARPDVAISYRAGYRSEHALRLKRVDVTSKPWNGGVAAPRELLRRYHLDYDAQAHRSLLTSLQQEGRCSAAVVEDATQKLPLSQCSRLPALRFEYQRIEGDSEPLHDAQGYAFDPFDTTLHTLAGSPPHSLDEPLTDLTDIDGDGLPDVLVTAAGLFRGGHGVYLNGRGGQGLPGFGAPHTMAVRPAADVVDADVLALDSPVVAALDLDADGLVNLVHMPRARRYSVFSPRETSAGSDSYEWVGREVLTASQQDVKIDFTRDAANTRVLDVNGDGLVDIVYGTATELQTFFALGRYPGGDDQFGQATWTSWASANISNEPVRHCVPWSSAPLRFSDPDTRLADIDGDGLADIVRVRSGQVLYWPGRGNGFWGTGDRADCSGEGFAQERHVELLNPPHFGTTQPGTLLFSDVNGDGLSDLVEVRNQAVDVYLNDNGIGFTDRTTLEGVPFLPNGSNYVRLTDIDGSGTPDILWGRAREYQYIDLTGGKTPHLLTRIQNGLGKTVELEYASSTELMLAAAAAGAPWSSRAPLATPVLRRMVVRDNLERVGRPAGRYVTEYSYRDPVFEGRQREFRGFREAIVKAIGDANSPTSSQRTVFELGECRSNAAAPFDVCETEERWRDNWRDALKGLPVLSEAFDENGVYLATQHTSYRLGQLYTGLDGRRVIAATPMIKDTFAYDTTSFDRVTATVTRPALDITLSDFAASEARTITLRASAGRSWLSSQSIFDLFGNQTDTIDYGCGLGCPSGASDEVITAHSDFALPVGDGSGWLWREQRSYVTGSIDTARRNEQVRVYGPSGLLEESYAVLSGTLPLDRFHQVGGFAIAPSPPGQSGGQSTAVQILGADPSYDAFGQVTFARGPNGRCVSSAFDATYAQLPVTARVYVGTLAANNCGSRELVQTMTYDRGLEAPLSTIDARGQPTAIEYDAFGLLRQVTHADPNNPGSLNPLYTARAGYLLTNDPDAYPYTLHYSEVLTSTAPVEYAMSYEVRDGLGRTIAKLAPSDPASGDPGQYIVSGDTVYDAKGAIAHSYDPWFADGGYNLELGGTAYKSQEFDAFGQAIRSYGYDHTIESYVARRGLAVDVYDAADILPTPHQNTYVTLISDGHGRGVQRIERVKVGTQLELRRTINEHLPTGQLRRSIQRRTGSEDVVRFMRYDSLGRMVLNAEPNTSRFFNPDPNTPPDQIKAIRYAYDDAGDMVGRSDARGCGANYHYDTAGRLLAEDRSPCLAAHAPYSAPDLTTGNGTESFYRYDSADPDTASITATNPAFTVDAASLLGRVVSHSAMGAKTVFRYDSLGRGTAVAVRVQKPGTPNVNLTSRYAPRWYVRMQTLDALDRVVVTTTGVTTPELLGADGTSELRFSYGSRGTVTSIGSSYGTLLASRQLLADGRVQSFTLGDAAGTQRYFSYDAKHRERSIQTYRGNIPLWSTPPAGSGYTPPSALDDPTAQLLLEDVEIGYDEVGAITSIADHREPGAWPASAKPVSRTFEYDDSNRLIRASYGYTGAVDSWRSPYHAENQDPTRVQPSPHVSFTTRLSEQRYRYDWLGNITQSTDDQQAFWDRSTGDRGHGSAGSGPHRVYNGDNRALAPASTRKGDLSVNYDASGNLSDLVVRRDGPCLPASASCWQRFAYDWDELGQLVRARRWDLSAAERTSNGQLNQSPPARAGNAELSYGYAGEGSRTLKTALTGGVQKHTVYVFSTLELRSTDWDGTDYAQNAQTVSLRLQAGPVSARVVYGPADMPSIGGQRRHLFLELADALGSGKALIDHATSELVEYTSYQAYGAIESDYRPSRWRGFREAYKFSGKEEDIEVGLAFFGARYYSPYLGVWISPDPVAIHELGSDPNPYAYVHGTPLMGIDPDGRFVTLVALLVAAVIGAVVAAVASVAVQAATVGWSHIDWRKVGGAAAIGFVAGAVSCGVGGAIGGALAAATGSALAGGIVGGMVGGAMGGFFGYSTGVMTGMYESSGSGLGYSVLGGMVTGAIGGGVGASLGSSLGASVTSGLITSTSGYAFQGLTTGDWSVQSLLVSVGSGLASSVASWSARGSVEAEPGRGPYPAESDDVPVEIVGGTPKQRAEVLEAVLTTFSYEKGQEFLQGARAYAQKYGHKMQLLIKPDGGNAVVIPHGDWNDAYVRINPDASRLHVIDRSPGTGPLGVDKTVLQFGSLARVVAHEFGHAFTGLPDGNARFMQNVIANENTWAQQAGLLPRASYCQGPCLNK